MADSGFFKKRVAAAAVDPLDTPYTKTVEKLGPQLIQAVV